MNSKAFTLVELAIVITIIGLLIGGVLKGQELLQNARMTSAASLIKALDTAAITFKDVYKALPGDITDPTNFIQGCTTSPCIISGDRNGIIGPMNSYSDENNNFFLHLSKAGLINSVDPNSTWTSGTMNAASLPQYPLGGRLWLRSYQEPTTGSWPQGLAGGYWLPTQAGAPGNTWTPAVPNNVSAKLDLKIDDGRPYYGDMVMLHTGCAGFTVYDPNNTTLCYPGFKAGF